MSVKIGLTGGIASGKSMVSQFLQEKGICVIDGDVVAREVVVPGSQGLQQIVERFGREILDAQGQLDRKKLGNLVFHHHEYRHALDDIMAPLMRAEIDKKMLLYEQKQKIVVFDMALLIEQGYQQQMDEVWLVVATVTQQIQRMEQRDGLDEKQARARIDCQMSTNEKIPFATVIIDNSRDKQFTYSQVEQQLERLRRTQISANEG